MSSMSNQIGDSELGRATSSNVDLLGNPTTLLVFKHLNRNGGLVYTNEQHEYAILENSQGGTQIPPRIVEVIDHGDYYMGFNGSKVFKTTQPNEMDCWGNLVYGSD